MTTGVSFRPRVGTAGMAFRPRLGRLQECHSDLGWGDYRSVIQI